MYYANQTLRNIKTNQLAALYPLRNISTFNWEVGHNTNFIDEDGKRFTDDIANWTCVTDWFDRAAISVRGEKSTSKFIDTTLKKYLFFSKEEREIKKEEALKEWRDKILKQLETEDCIRNWYADGSVCILFKRYFMAFVGAKPLIHAWCSISKEFTPRGNTFKYKKRKFYIGYGCHDEISLIK